MTSYEEIILLNYLIKKNIPFDIAFEPSTSKTAATLQLTVHISSKITVTIQLQ